MNNKIFLRLLIITIILAFCDIIIFSPGIVALSFALNPLLFCLAVGFNVFAIGCEVIYLLKSNTAKYGYDLEKLKDAGHYKYALESCYTKKSPFANEIKIAIKQLNSINNKRNILTQILEQNNQEHFTVLTDLGDQASSFIENNIRKILNRIAIFDSETDDNMLSEHKSYISVLLKDNETILKEFNKMLTEASQLDDSSTDYTLQKALEEMTNSLQYLRGD